MKWMVFSDTHLGSAVSHRYKELYTLVKSKQPDRLIILGDFIDFWRVKYSKVIKNKNNLKLIDYVLRQLPEQGVEVFYIFGNHEDTDKEFLRTEFPKVKFVELLVHFDIVLTHGHRFDSAILGKGRIKSMRISKFRQFIESILPIDLSKIGMMIDKLFHLGITKKYVKDVHDKVIEKYSNQYKAAIIGHTHCHQQRIVEYSKQNPSAYDSGDTYDECPQQSFTLYDSGNTYTDLNYYLFEDGDLIEVGE